MKPTTQKDVSIIIVNYNTVDLVLACLASIKHAEFGKYTYEIILIDNGSKEDPTDKIHKSYPDVNVHINTENRGFAAGNNIGIKMSNARYILLLNSDTEVGKTSIAVMIAFMDEHKTAGASTCFLRLQNGKIDPACHRGFPTPWSAFTYFSHLESLFPNVPLFSGYHQWYKDLRRSHEIDCLSGAFFLVRKSVIDSVGLLDEDYFMYAEDIDWAYRIKKAGWSIWFHPEVEVLHKKKQSGRKNADRKLRVKTDIYFHENNWRFYKKHYLGVYGPLQTAIVGFYYMIRLFLLKHFSL